MWVSVALSFTAYCLPLPRRGRPFGSSSRSSLNLWSDRNRCSKVGKFLVLGCEMSQVVKSQAPDTTMDIHYCVISFEGWRDGVGAQRRTSGRNTIPQRKAPYAAVCIITSPRTIDAADLKLCGERWLDRTFQLCRVALTKDSSFLSRCINHIIIRLFKIKSIW